MSPHDPANPTPPALDARRNPGDAWVVAPTGQRYWGRYGAAGVMIVHPDRGVLLQHRALWSHHGGTWGLPGGALHEGELPLAAALREADEEAGAPADALAPFATLVADKGVWRYTTVLARLTRDYVPSAHDGESLELRWVKPLQVSEYPLHPGFAGAWPTLARMVDLRPALVVDAANVVGSRPDGWWKDRRGAAERLMARLGLLHRVGVPAGELDLPGERWHPPIEVVLEGAARGADALDCIEVSEARSSGDDQVVDSTRARLGNGEQVTAVTSDRALRERLEALGATVRGAGWLLRTLDRIASD
ncbi:NUDIX domain-containing protein [Demequina sp.]|uniref:NUDIX domain-containing protein n=1 Tax=Demequina sp. TaxID=2050685 RepID=UPI003A85DDD4